MVLTAVGLPTDMVGLIYGIDWFLDRFRTGTHNKRTWISNTFILVCMCNYTKDTNLTRNPKKLLTKPLANVAVTNVMGDAFGAAIVDHWVSRQDSEDVIAHHAGENMGLLSEGHGYGEGKSTSYT
jgi:Na+/H+-dicarboxylate symporter